MTVLVTGATGTVGARMLDSLLAHGVETRALTRSPDDASLPDGVQAVAGSIGDPDSFRTALDGIEGVFLLSAVTADELTATLNALDLIRTAGIRAVTYLSVIHADVFTDPSHFAAKRAAERMIIDLGIPATILRPGYYIQNDVAERDGILDHGTYSSPVGGAGVLVTDVRDLGEVASATLRQRLDASEPLPPRLLDVVAPQLLTGASIARLWADALDREVSYGGDDLDAFEQGMLAASVPGWMAHDFRLMMRRFQTNGMTAAPGTDDALQALLGRPMRSYADFVRETALDWQTG